MTCTVGILIVGSLYWSPEQHRQQWRSEHLKQGSQTAVSVPIRYGRLSRAGTYTMVFAPGSPNGVGKVCECASPISAFAGLLEEAKALWTAETPDGQPTDQLAADWGCVGLLPNPKFSCAPKVLAQWAQHVERQLSNKTKKLRYDWASSTVKGACAVNTEGILQIPWPTPLVDGYSLDKFDVLLAAATRPTPTPATGDYPSVQEIAEAWNAKGDAAYFYSNRKNGLRSFQDEAIATLLRV